MVDAIKNRGGNYSKVNIKDMAEVRLIFNSIDNNNSGTLDKGEVQEALNKMGKCELSEDSLNKVFKKYDANNDGGIDINEFVSMLQDMSNGEFDTGLDRHSVTEAFAPNPA